MFGIIASLDDLSCALSPSIQTARDTQPRSDSVSLLFVPQNVSLGKDVC